MIVADVLYLVRTNPIKGGGIVQYKTPLSDATKRFMEKAFRAALEAESERTDDKTRIRRAAGEAAWEVGVKRQKENSQNIDDWIDELTRRYLPE